MFSENYLVEGEKGGKDAATDLKQHLMKEFGGAGSLCTTLYMNMTGLRDYLVSKNVCTASDFDGFVVGFNRSTELFSIVDCSQGKEAADAKIRGAPIAMTTVPPLHDPTYLNPRNAQNLRERPSSEEDRIRRSVPLACRKIVAYLPTRRT